jgi:hypothetical protein
MLRYNGLYPGCMFPLLPLLPLLLSFQTHSISSVSFRYGVRANDVARWEIRKERYIANVGCPFLRDGCLHCQSRNRASSVHFRRDTSLQHEQPPPPPPPRCSVSLTLRSYLTFNCSIYSLQLMEPQGLLPYYRVTVFTQSAGRALL